MLMVRLEKRAKGTGVLEWRYRVACVLVMVLKRNCVRWRIVLNRRLWRGCVRSIMMLLLRWMVGLGVGGGKEEDREDIGEVFRCLEMRRYSRGY